MKKFSALILVGVLTPIVTARVWITAYQYDGKTPLAAVDANHPDVYRDIMVGTRLTLVISSDASVSWGGNLFTSWDDARCARLSGRGFAYFFHPWPFNSFSIPNYADSCLDAAGTGANVRDLVTTLSTGLSFNNDATPYITGGHPAYPGDWFVVDYHAEQVGHCQVELQGGGSPGSGTSPVGPATIPYQLLQTLSLTHVPSRDLNGDAAVDLKDFALFASHWRDATDPNSPPKTVFDLNGDGQVDTADLTQFSEYWLARTDSSASPAQFGTAAKP